MCPTNSMFQAPGGNEYGASFYGTAAISAALGGANWLGSGCGKCFKITGNSNISGHSGVQSVIVLKATNFCPDGNPACENGK